ncbi:MAG: PilZ domain-containing protein [Chromatiales bacterium]|nr:PilZ domain-containing protein [Chromatiales bacterium]
MIEHRHSRRRPIEAEVILNYRSLGLIHGKSKNLSRGGLFVDLGCVQLPLNAMVGVALMLAGEDHPRTVSADAMIVHQASGGVGLMFRYLDRPSEVLINELIHIESHSTVANM